MTTTDAFKVIVVAEKSVYDLLAGCGAQWDVQHHVETIGQMWDDLSAHRLDPNSRALVFSDSLPCQPGELEATLAAMAPHAPVFVVAWRPDDAEALLARVRQAAAEQGQPEAPIFMLSTTSGRDLLDGIRQVLDGQVVMPQQWEGDVDGPLLPDPELQWQPSLLIPEEATGGSAASAAGDLDAGLAGQVFAPVSGLPAAVAQAGAAGTMPPPPPTPIPAPEPPAGMPQVASVSPASGVATVAGAPPLTPPVAAPAPVQAAAGAPAQVAVTQPHPPQPTPAGSREAGGGEIPAAVPLPQVIAVTSSKGGSGKSTTAVMLAAQIATSSALAAKQGLLPRPLRVVLVDMDTRDGQISALLNKFMPTALNIRVAPQWDEETIARNLIEAEALGIKALLAPIRPRTADDVGPDFYRHVIHKLRGMFDVVVLDTSVQYLDPLLATVCLPEATQILFVTTMVVTSVQGMARAFREIIEPVERGGLGIDRNKIRVVINQAAQGLGMELPQLLQATLRVPVIGAIPMASKDVIRSANEHRMHTLLKHPLLGPAYFQLATTCLPGVPLVELIKPKLSIQPVAATPTQHTGPVAPVGADTAVSPGGQRKWRLFGRK